MRIHRFAMGAAFLAVLTGARAAPPPVEACGSAAHHQFDFFAGDWDTHDLDNHGAIVARNRVTRILGGCVILEEYEQTDGLSGKSYSIYDSARQAWHQSWVTNRGVLALLDGGMKGDTMVLTGTQSGADGRLEGLRGIWYRDALGVREIGLTSGDGGRTWVPAFDIRFTAHQGS